MITQWAQSDETENSEQSKRFSLEDMDLKFIFWILRI